MTITTVTTPIPPAVDMIVIIIMMRGTPSALFPTSLSIKQDFPGYYEELNEITISKDGDFIIAASRERMVKVWIDFLYYLDRIGLYQ